MPARKKKRPSAKRAPAKRKSKTTRRKPRAGAKDNSNPLAELRRQAQTVIKQLQTVGWQRINAIERQIEGLNRQRQALVNELSSVVRGVGGVARGGTTGTRRAAASTGRRGGRARVDWDKVYTKLPRGSFQAGDVRRLVPGVAGGTLSQRLTAWVKAKKLRRTGSRRGTRYTRI